jgi:hypothetical protein
MIGQLYKNGVVKLEKDNRTGKFDRSTGSWQLTKNCVLSPARFWLKLVEQRFQESKGSNNSRNDKISLVECNDLQ